MYNGHIIGARNHDHNPITITRDSIITVTNHDLWIETWSRKVTFYTLYSFQIFQNTYTSFNKGGRHQLSMLDRRIVMVYSPTHPMWGDKLVDKGHYS